MSGIGADHPHSHLFLGDSHERNERQTWAVISLCGAMMIAEVGGGLAFGSIALIADGLHMSTHAGALLLAALAYTYARKYADDPRFSFGTGKLGDLAGYTSAIVLAMIAILIGYEAVSRILEPVPIRFSEAIAIASVGLGVNVASVWLLAGSGHPHNHEDGHEHWHDSGHRDHNLRAAMLHVGADTAVSVLVIIGLVLARSFDWLWMDPLAGIVGAFVIASWSYGLIRDTGAILLDTNPDSRLTGNMRALIESDGDSLRDFHLWRLGPGHLGAIVSVMTSHSRGPAYYRRLLAHLKPLSHVTIEVERRGH
jgi:cation diffusion facilitator family transporter